MAWGLVPFCLAGAESLGPDSPASAGVQVADLKQQLDAGLRARRPQEFAFIERVVVMVRDRELPLDVVKSTFLWARKKEPYPFPYFELALRIRANRLGVSIIVPPLPPTANRPPL